MLTDVEFLPFGMDIIYAKVTNGENEYFRVYCLFSYKEKRYVIYAYTIDPNDVQIAEVEKFEEAHDEDGTVDFIFVEIAEDAEFAEVASAWNDYLAYLDEQEENQTSAE